MKKPVKIVLISLLVLVAIFPYAFVFSVMAAESKPRARAEDYVYSSFTILSRTDIRQGGPEILWNLDTHGGFLGDGDWTAVLRYRDDSLSQTLADNPEWRALPLSDTLCRAVNCFANDGRGDGFDLQTPMLAAENGYYFFLDRQKTADNTDPKDESKLLSRYSVNFTLAVWDADAATLYILEMDT